MKKKILLLIIFSFVLISGCGKKEEENPKDTEKKDNEVVVEEKVEIVDLESNTRPYAVVVNNYPGAVKVHSGLNKAYMVYEFPIEGGITRSLALFKDVSDVKIGTVRSARHDYLDYALENDAIFVHFGWSKSAEQDISSLKINNIDGNTSDSSVFWRENPLKLASEHTVYTNLSKVIEYNTNKKKYRSTTDVKPPLNYVTNEVELSSYEDSIVANNVKLSYSGSFNVEFKYDSNSKVYNRYVKGNAHTDYFTKEQYTAKNIVVVLLDWGVVSKYADAAGNNYLDLYNTGKGNGYYITNGYARKITWEKKDRSSQTVYKYADGSIVDINDGNTYVMFQSNSNGVGLK